MSEEVDDLPCVLVLCTAGYNLYYVWLEEDWDRDAEHWVNTGRKLIARASNTTCRALREILNQQKESNHAN
jgi:hypothetical protein